MVLGRFLTAAVSEGSLEASVLNPEDNGEVHGFSFSAGGISKVYVMQSSMKGIGIQIDKMCIRDRYIGAENVLDEIQNNLRKDTVGALQQHLKFFNKIKGEVDKVFTYGFSFSEVDRIYIREICKRLPDNAVWYLNDYDDSDKREQFASILRSFGFLGEIADYHIQN